MVSFTPIDQDSGSSDSGVGNKIKFVPVDDPAAQAAADAHTAMHPAEGKGSPGVQQVDAAIDEFKQGMRSVQGGQSFGWINELSADEYAATVGAENLFRRATGKTVPYGVGEARTAMLHERRRSAEDFHERHPHLDEALEFGGAMTVPMGKTTKFIGRGANWLTRAGRTALVGGAVGAVGGASDERDRSGAAKSGAITGGILSGGLHLLGSAAVSGLPALSRLMKTPMVETWHNVQALFGVEDKNATPSQIAAAQKKALEYVHNVAQEAGKTWKQIARNVDRRLGKPVIGAEAIGRPGVSQLAAVGRRSGETPAALESTLRQRAQWLPSRVESDLSEITGTDPAAIAGEFSEQIKKLRQDADPLYKVAYKDKVDTPVLRRLLERPSVQKALGLARRLAKEEDLNPEDVGLVLKGPEKVGAHADDAYELVEVRNPTMRTWDLIKRALDSGLEKSRDKVTRKLNTSDAEIKLHLDTVTELRSELFRASPAYENAVAHGGEAPRQIEAYQAAPKLMSPTVPQGVFEDRLSKMTPAQKEALKGGLIADIYNRVTNGKLRLRDMQSPAFIQKARKILGFEQADRFLEKAESEMRLQANGQRMMPGTQSATMELTAADAEREQKVTSMARAAWEFGKGNPGKALAHLLTGASGVAQTAELDTVTRNEVGRLLMLPPKQLARVLYDYEKTRSSEPAKSFVRHLADDPMALAAGRRLAIAFVTQQTQLKAATR